MTTPDSNNLNERLTPQIDYTHRDEIIFRFVDITTCPIEMETTDDMIIFNHQFYDRTAFDRHHRNKLRASSARLSSGYEENSTNNRFKDSKTGTNYNPRYARRTLYQSRPSSQDIEASLFERLPPLSPSLLSHFIPQQSNNEEEMILLFTSHITQLDTSRVDNCRLYTAHIKQLQNSAASRNVAHL